MARSPSADAVLSLGRKGSAGWRSGCGYCTEIPPSAEDLPNHLVSHLQTIIGIVPILGSPVPSGCLLADGRQ